MATTRQATPARATPVRRVINSRDTTSPATAPQRPQNGRVTRRRPELAPPPAPAGVDLSQRLQWEYVDINDIHPYEYNPRDNAKAIAAVANSIRSFGFLIPVVLDANNILVAGHTRVEAAKVNGMAEVPAVRATYLTPEQINAFRLIDNKVAEQASWDFDLLSSEISKLSGLGLDFTQFGWTQEEIDCLGEVVASDCLTAADVTAQAEVTNAAAGAQNRRAPTQARFVLGEIVLFLPISEYRPWVDGIRALHDFNEAAIHNDIKRRLGITQ